MRATTISIALAVAACGPLAAPDTTITLHVSGTVTAAMDGSPIAGATVSVYVMEWSRDQVIEGHTDHLGYYSLSFAETGSCPEAWFKIRVSAPGFPTVEYTGFMGTDPIYIRCTEAGQTIHFELGETCGDGSTDTSESCDDGNTITETACPYGTPWCVLCNDDCSLALNLTGAYCGNGVIDAPDETCDEGDTAFCQADCTAAECGDSYTNHAAGEACDDGNTVNETACPPTTPTCTACNASCDTALNLALDQDNLYGTCCTITMMHPGLYQQTVTAGTPGVLSSIWVQIEEGYGSGILQFSLYEGRATPKSTPIFTQDIDTLSLSSDDFIWDLTSQEIILDRGTVFTFGIRGIGVGAGARVADDRDNQYRDGELLLNGLPFDPPRDLAFQTYVLE